MLGSSAFRLMCFYARVHERLCACAFVRMGRSWEGVSPVSAVLATVWVP